MKKGENNEYKKMISLFMSLILAFSITIISHAEDSQVSDAPVTEVVEEEVIITELKSFTDNELLEQGFSNEEIVQIRNFNYEEELKKRAALDHETLLLYGYTNDEIVLLRNYASGKASRGTISANTMTTSLSVVDKSIGTSKRTAKFKFTWSWKRLPLLKIMDSVAVAWTSLEGNSFAFLNNDNNSVTLMFKKINSEAYGPDVHTEKQKWTANDYRSIETSFGVSTGDYFVMDGVGFFEIESTSATGRLYIEAGYAHRIVGFTAPNLSIGTGGAFGFSLNFGITSDSQIRKQLYADNLTLSQTYS